MPDTSSATLLFCDLVGSTELFSRVGDDAADELRRAIFDALRAALDEFGGVEVKHLGDGLMAVFTSSAALAIGSAVSMQRRLHEMDDASDVGRIQLRVGISTGEVASEDGDWFGRPVIEAARLCAVATPETILVSDVTRSVAGTRGGHRFTSVGPLDLKGLGAPVPSSAVEWRVDGTAPRGPLVAPAARHRSTMHRRWKPALLLVAAAVALVGFLVLRPNGSGSARDALAAAPRGYTPRLRNVECDAELTAAEPDARCAHLIVPENRADPDGRQVELLVRRVPALPGVTPAEPTVSIGLEAPADELLNSSVRTRGEHIALVTRGAPGSQPAMECPDLNRHTGRDLAFAPADPQRSVDRAQVVTACRDKLVDEGFDLGAYGSRDAALDIRDLAVAMELGQINLQAGYTETRVARAVAVAAPGLLRSVVLQDVQPPERNGFDEQIITARGALDRYIAECEAVPACNAAAPDLPASVARVHADFNARPASVVVSSPVDPTTQLTVLVDGDRAIKTLVDGLGDPLALPLLAATIHAPNPEVVAQYAAVRNSVPDEFPNPARLARYCIDEAPLANQLLRQTSMDSAPLLRSLGFEPGSDVCSSWDPQATARSEKAPAPSTGGVPTLILSADLNPYTSPKWADDTARSFGGATVVRLPHLTIDPLRNGPPCVGELRTAFLRHPDRPVDARACIDAIGPIQFGSG